MMLNIKQIREDFPFYEARNAEHYGVHRKITFYITDELAELLKFSPLLTMYKNWVATANDCYLRTRGWETTPEVVTADEKRDKLFSFISQVITASQLSPVEETAKAANRLKFIIKPYAKAYNLSLFQETTALVDFIEKLENETNQADVEKVGLTDAVAALKEANAEFEALFDARASERLTRSESETMKTVRPKVDEMFSYVAKTINVLYMLNEMGEKDPETSEKLGAVIDNINAVLLELENSLVHAGIIKKSGKKEDEGGDEPTPEPEPVAPEITAIYPKEGADPENPLLFRRGEQTVMEFQGFTLKGQGDTLEHVIALVEEFDRFTEWIKPEVISNVTDTSCEFTMVPDLAEGKYKVRVETYDGGSPLVVEFAEMIKLE